MTDGPMTTYTTQDYSAVNEYVEHLAERHRAAVAIRRADIFAVYAKWFAVLIAAAGVAALLVLWGMSLFKERPDPEIVEPVIVDKPVTINIPPQSAPHQNSGDPEVQRQLREIRSTIENIRGSTKSDSSPGDRPRTVVDFVIFKEIKFQQAGIEDVVVGMSYEDSNSTSPNRQWCYVIKPNASGTATRVELAGKVGDHKTDDQLTVAKARGIGASLKTLTAAQRLCAFE